MSIEQLPPPPAVPVERDLISWGHERRTDGPKHKWVTIFRYPDCDREFDGREWTVTRDLREEAQK